MNDSHDCRCFEKDGMEKSDFRAAKKGGKKPHSRKAVLHAVEQEIGLAREGYQEKGTPRSGSVAVAIAIPTQNRELDRGA